MNILAPYQKRGGITEAEFFADFKGLSKRVEMHTAKQAKERRSNALKRLFAESQCESQRSFGRKINSVVPESNDSSTDCIVET